jgi:beta-glucosidase
VDDLASPLYPFGHGLSYTQFTYRDLKISPAQVQAGQQVQITLQVTNSGARAGDEVVQLYLRDVYASVPRPVKELKGFVRLTLQPGESRQIRFDLPVDQLAFYNLEMKLVVEAGTFEVMVGNSSEDIRLRGTLEVVGALVQPIARRVFTCPYWIGE